LAKRIRRIGFVGLGRMGLPMACRLAGTGFEVRGFDVAEPAREAFARAAAGLAVRTGRAADGLAPSGSADTLAGAAEDADAVVLVLPGSEDLVAVARDQGLLSAMRPETLLIDMGAAGPAATGKLAAAARARGIHVVGAPVCGGVCGATDGTLTIVADGACGAVRRARPVLDALGSRVIGADSLTRHHGSTQHHGLT
jgi:3-hydroxyisobutyrate dehydrogenase